MSRGLSFILLLAGCSPKRTTPTPDPTPSAVPADAADPLASIEELFDAGAMLEARVRWFELDAATRERAAGLALDRRFGRISVSFTGRELGSLPWTPEAPSLPADLLLLGFWEVDGGNPPGSPMRRSAGV